MSAGTWLAGDFAVDGYVARNGVLGETDLACAEAAIAPWAARQIAAWTGKPARGGDSDTGLGRDGHEVPVDAYVETGLLELFLNINFAEVDEG